MLEILAAAFAVVAADPEPLVLQWSDLLPEEEQGQTTAAIDHSGGPMEQTGSSATVDALDGQYIAMPGFMLPLDYTEKGKVTAFLLVPYYGACIHVPPPPPNQIVYVDTAGKPVKSRGLWDRVTVTGTMVIKRNDNGLGDAAYTLELEKLEQYKR
ncbi:MAG: DUF3299 domain-containing protein [Parvularcula sp.]